MKKLITLFVISIFFLSDLQSKTLSGNWREVKRSDAAGSLLKFDDTIHLAFLTGGEYTWHQKRVPITRGTYKISDKSLDMGARSFTIVKQTNNKLVLKDFGAIYEFESYLPDTDDKMVAEEKPTSVINPDELIGKWNVYKRTSEKVMKQIDYSTLVEDVVIEQREGSWGYITSSASPHEKDGWKIVSIENGTLNAEGKTSRQFEISRRDNELILKEEGVTYFLKRF